MIPIVLPSHHGMHGLDIIITMVTIRTMLQLSIPANNIMCYYTFHTITHLSTIKMCKTVLHILKGD